MIKNLRNYLIVGVIGLGIMGCTNGNTNSVAPTSPKPYLKIIKPNKNSKWQEGKAHKIIWESNINDMLCIEAAVGGHNLGILNDCNTVAKQGYFTWNISKGRLSDFGPTKFNDVKIIIYPKNNPDKMYMSDEFTVYK